MTAPILIDHETSTEQLLDVLERILSVLSLRIGSAKLVAILFGMAVRTVIEEIEAADGE